MAAERAQTTSVTMDVREQIGWAGVTLFPGNGQTGYNWDPALLAMNLTAA